MCVTLITFIWCYNQRNTGIQKWISLHRIRLLEKFGFLVDPGFFFHRIAPKLVANILVNINSGVLGVLLMIFFGDPICVQPTMSMRLFPKKREKERRKEMGCTQMGSPKNIIKRTPRTPELMFPRMFATNFGAILWKKNPGSAKKPNFSERRIRCKEIYFWIPVFRWL